MGRTKEQLQEDIRVLDAMRAPLLKQLQSILDAEKADRCSVLQNGITLESVMSVNAEDLGEKWHRKVYNFLEHECFEGSLQGLYPSGYNPDTGQIAFQMKLSQKEALEKQMGLLTLLPLIKATDGWKVFRIFRWDCGERGSWYVRVNEDSSTWEIHSHHSLRHEFRSPERSFQDGKEALAYILKHHPYECEGGNPDED